MEIIVDQYRRQAFVNSIKAMADFKAAFGRGLSGDFVAELYAADELGLRVAGRHQSGYDALGPNDERYQVKFRSIGTQNVDINNFDFDYLVLVNMDDDYQLIGMWRITVAQAREIFVEHLKFRKYQTTQSKVKSVGEALPMSRLEAKPGNIGLPTTAGRRWREIRGRAPHPLLEMDAQKWVSKARQQDDEQSGQTR